jgi:general secretion pathway protein L
VNKTIIITTLVAIRDFFFRWIDSVADFAYYLLGRFTSSPMVRLIEVKNGQFVLDNNNEEVAEPPMSHGCIQIVDGQIDPGNSTTLAGTLSDSQIELVLQSERFIFRPLELPNRATEFLPGIVRSQIDRLTPWNADDAAFGWSKPAEADAEKMVVTVAATALALIRPYTQAIANYGAQSIAVCTTSPEAGIDAVPIKVWEQKGPGGKNIYQIGQALITILVVAGITAGFALGARAIVAANISSQQDELARRISGVRAAAGITHNGELKSMLAAKWQLARRKHDSPLTVLVLETLSKILPDNTYLTELRVEGNKLRLTGITQDAPSLIGLIEQSGRFTRATFFAPTRRSHSVDHFSIEATIKPLGPSS